MLEVGIWWQDEFRSDQTGYGRTHQGKYNKRGYRLRICASDTHCESKDLGLQFGDLNSGGIVGDLSEQCTERGI